MLLSYKQANTDIEEEQFVETVQHIASQASVGTIRIYDHREQEVERPIGKNRR